MIVWRWPLDNVFYSEFQMILHYMKMVGEKFSARNLVPFGDTNVDMVCHTIPYHAYQMKGRISLAARGIVETIA